MIFIVVLFYFSCFAKDKSMTEGAHKLLRGDDVDIIYGDDWYFKMAKKHLSHNKTSECQITLDSSNRKTLTYTKTLKDAA